MKPQNTYDVSVPPRGPGDQIHATLAHIEATRPTSVRLWAGSLEFATPIEICGLRALIDRAAAIADEVHFDCPRNPHVNRYLERVDFYEGLPPNVSLSEPRPRLQRRDHERDLIELVQILECDDVAQLMTRVNAVARGAFGPQPVARACATAIGAATENAIEHAESPIGALVAAQRYGQTLEVAVVDLGAGIPATLARNPDHRGLTDLDAVLRALERGVSSLATEGRGGGLPQIVRHAARSRNATLIIASSQARLHISWRGRARRQNTSVPPLPVRGTWIAARFEVPDK
jgi:anti-sigma regulatory factor (Ser/Thr protein kinase)